MKHRHIIATLALQLIVALHLSPSAHAAPVNAGLASRASSAWARTHRGRMGIPHSTSLRSVRTHHDAQGHALYHSVDFDPGGFLVVSADDRVVPVVAFSATGQFDPDPDNPLVALLEGDMGARLQDLRDEDRGRRRADRTRGFHHEWTRERWENLLEESSPDDGEGTENGTFDLDDIRVPELLTTRWNQRTVGGAAVYNYYTPPFAPGNATNYYTGCVSTVLAQILRYHAQPTPVGTALYEISVNGNPSQRALMGGDGLGGQYRWDLMPDSPLATSTEFERQAIGRLMHDTGLSVGMDYGPTASSANTLDTRAALIDTFGFAGASSAYNGGGSIPVATVAAILNPNLDAGLPVILGIQRDGGSHAVVCDGYGYASSILYHHINLGWGGMDNAWYALPTIDCVTALRTYTSIRKIVYNASPAAAGEIVSGRILDAATGAPIAGATVTAGAASDTSDARGVYALTGLLPRSTNSVTISAQGFAPEQFSVAVGLSSNKTTLCGNVWGSDAQLESAGKVRFSSWPSSVAEPSAPHTITVERLGPASGPASVTIAGEESMGTAIPNIDYAISPTTVSWGPGETGPRTVLVELIDDGECEGEETIALSLAQPINAGFDDPSTITIQIESNGLDFPSWLSSSGLEATGQTECSDDPDCDGCCNFEEYAFAGNPLDSSDGAAISPGPRMDEGRLRIQFRQLRDATDISYIPEFSSDLISWELATDDPQIIGSGDTFDVLSVIDPNPYPLPGPRFARVRLVRHTPEAPAR